MLEVSSSELRAIGASETNTAVTDALYLFNQSPNHLEYTLAEFTAYGLLPLAFDKARLFYRAGKPTGLVTWAFLTNDEASAFLQSSFTPTEETYLRNSGDQLWGIEFISPFGDSIPVMREMRQHSKRLYGPLKCHWRRVSKPTDLHVRNF